MDLFRAYTIADALSILRDHVRLETPGERLGLREALHRTLDGDVFAPEDVPAFDRSTMDGFAVRARDTFGASEGLPAYLNVAGEVLMGEAPRGRLEVGHAFRIATGGMLPEGADAVVMVEYTEELDAQTIGVTRPVAPGENTIRCGDDLAGGTLLLPGGHRLRSQDVGLLAAAGVDTVPVRRPLRVGVITTGDEVVPVEETPGPGQVRDVNSYTLGGQVCECGAEPVIYGIVRDDFESLIAVVRRALDETEAVMISGGSSVGRRDVTVDVLAGLGEPGVLFHGLAVRPGKPTIGAAIGEKLILGLPGHPVSAMVVFSLLARPLLDPGYRRFPIRARITRSLSSQAGKEDYVRVRLSRDGERLVAEPIPGKSGLIATMVRADGLARIPLESQGVAAGEEVEVIPF
ncbi:MAG: molybdopterin molybdotransferase MoeA [Candidatus Desulforudis sp.]|nr:molybdopterin molybdotransferase MoeA [Desulforudis sp.]